MVNLVTLKNLYDASPFGFAYHEVVQGPNGTPEDFDFLYVNPVFEELTGLSLRHVLNQPITKILPSTGSGAPDWVDIYGKVASEGKQEIFEHYSDTLGRWYQVHAYLIDSDHLATVFLDITKDKQHEEELEQLIASGHRHLTEGNAFEFQRFIDEIRAISEAKYAVLNLYDDAEDRYRTVAVSVPGKILAEVSKRLGFSIIGKEWPHDPVLQSKIPETTYIFPDLRTLSTHTLPSSIALIVEKLAGIGQVVLVKIMHGNRMLGDFTLFMPKGKPFQKSRSAELYAQFFSLVLLRRKSDEERKQAAHTHEIIFNSTQDALFIAEATGPNEFRYLQTNNAHQKATGIPFDHLRGKTPQEAVGEESGNQVASNYQRCLESQKPLTYEETVESPEGKRTWLTTLTPVIGNGTPSYIVGSGTEITQQKETELALKTSRDELHGSRELYRKLSEDMPVFVSVCSADGTVRYSNPLFAGLLDCTPETLHGKNFLHLCAPQIRYDVEQHLKLLSPDQPIVSEIKSVVSSEGKRQWRRWTHRGFFDENGKLHSFQAIGQDITKEKEAEEELIK